MVVVDFDSHPALQLCGSDRDEETALVVYLVAARIDPKRWGWGEI